MYKPLFTLLTEDEMNLPFYVKSVGGRDNEDHVVRPGGYQDYHWIHSVKGKGRLIIAGREFTITDNMGFFFYPCIPHEYYPLNGLWSTHWITFDGYAVRPLLKLIGLGEWGVFHLPVIQLLEKLLHDIFITVQSDMPDKGYICSTLLYRFLIELKDCINPVGSRLKIPKQKQLQPVISFIEKKYNSNLSLEEMAAIINITPQHLCRLFKDAYNARPFEYITMVRLQKAKELILHPDKIPIKEVAQRAGYNDASYFCATFKEYEGITPVEFKKLHQ